jgi:hypothetical protein
MDSPLTATQTKKPESPTSPSDTLTITDNRTSKSYEEIGRASCRERVFDKV